jgi:hypothetical protein
MSFVNRSRRLGERLGVHGVVLSWNTRGRRRPRWQRRPFPEADVIDVSVTGAQLLAPESPWIQVGQLITVAAGGAVGTVRIRRIVPVTNGPLCMFGVEFIDLEPALQALLFTHLDDAGPSPEQVHWH